MKKILFLLLSVALLVGCTTGKTQNHRLPALGMPRSTVVAA